jgi:hypothetical protein
VDSGSTSLVQRRRDDGNARKSVKEKREDTDRLTRKRHSNAVLDEEACLNTFQSLRLVIVSGGNCTGIGDR